MELGINKFHHYIGSAVWRRPSGDLKKKKEGGNRRDTGSIDDKNPGQSTRTTKTQEEESAQTPWWVGGR
uniref:Uncharacterized protein n=1 Tax=Oryza sativa subsp. japonica TaxID=39947 RepID=Q6H6J5_ORYSJ|nr:hypothetical protein [Oryza sativa Japonica Group]